MNQPHVLLRIAAIASSLLLVGTLVLYRAGAFDHLLAAEADVGAHTIAGTMSSSDADTSLDRRQDDSSQGENDSAGGFATRFRILMRDTVRDFDPRFASSKSASHIIHYQLFDTSENRATDTSDHEEPISEEMPDTVPRRERFMGGSKSLAPIFEPDAPDTQKSAQPIPSKGKP